jgi:hypothetical protein
MKKKTPQKPVKRTTKKTASPNKPEKKWDTLKDSESLVEKAPPLKKSR